jgi:hypothetical protein
VLVRAATGRRVGKCPIQVFMRTSLSYKGCTVCQSRNIGAAVHVSGKRSLLPA